MERDSFVVNSLNPALDLGFNINAGTVNSKYHSVTVTVGLIPGAKRWTIRAALEGYEPSVLPKHA